jgi:2',3'-cyclic-nucleotide 2'-phosphodiesterase (5'-nucleotidase family)
MAIPPEQRKREVDRGQMFVDAFNQIGFDVQGIGEKDLVGGTDRLLALAKRAKYPFVSSNVIDAKTGKPLLKERVILEKAGVRIGVLSVMSPTFRDNQRLTAELGITVSDPFEAAKAQAAALRAEGAQAIVALAMLNGADAERLAKEVPDITAILGTADAMMQHYPRAVGHTYIADAFQKGKYLSALTLFVRKGELDAKELVFEDPNRKLSLERKAAELDARITAREKAIEDAKGDAARARNLQWLQQNLAKLRAERQEVQMQLDEAGAVDAAKSFIAYDYAPIAKDIEDQSKILALVDALKAKYPELKEPRH